MQPEMREELYVMQPQCARNSTRCNLKCVRTLMLGYLAMRLRVRSRTRGNLMCGECRVCGTSVWIYARRMREEVRKPSEGPRRGARRNRDSGNRDLRFEIRVLDSRLEFRGAEFEGRELNVRGSKFEARGLRHCDVRRNERGLIAIITIGIRGTIAQIGWQSIDKLLRR